MTTDERELIIKAQSGDKTAENALVVRYKNYVEVISRPYFLAGAEQDDIIQIGMIGLMKAIRTFNPDNEINFKTYSTKCIRNSILDGIREAGAKKNLPLNSSFAISEEDDENGYDIYQMPSGDPDPEQQYIAKEAEEAFFDALSQTLGETDLAIIKLYLSSMPYKEISEKLGITAKKVDNTIYNTKKKIEKLLKDFNK